MPNSGRCDVDPGEIIGPVSGFVVLAVAAVMALWSLLRQITH
jgi:hypothetical protein